MMSAARRQAAVAQGPLLLLVATTLFLGRAAAFGGVYAGGADMTDLQKHVSFFDANGDGIITINETYNGFRSLGFNAAASSTNAALINGALGSKTRPDNATSSHLDIYVENIYKGIHGSDTGAFDAQGRFVQEKFEAIFANHAKTTPNALTSSEVDDLLKADRKPGDLVGWAAATAEWRLLYGLAKDKDGLLQKEAVRGVYDGSLFHQLAKGGSGGN